MATNKKSKALAPEFQFDQDRPLDRMPDESSAAVRALMDYALMGVARSQEKLLKKYEEEMQKFLQYQADPDAWPNSQPVPVEPPTANRSTISMWSSAYKWPARVQRHDDLQVELDKLEFEAERRQLREERRSVLKLTLTRLKAALVQLNPNDASWGEVTSGIIKISNELRQEFGDADQDDAPRSVKMVVVRVGAGRGGEDKQDVINVPSSDVLAVDVDDD